MTLDDHPATLSDVARRAGVSVPTASRVLNGGVRGTESGSDQLRERVRSAAAELGYAPSAAAQTVKDGRSRSIAVIVGSVEDVGSSVLIGGVMRAAEDRGAAVAVRTTRGERARELAALSRLRADRPRAVIMAVSRTTDPHHEEEIGRALGLLERQGASIIVIGHSTLPFAHVVVDTVAASAELASVLAASGARRFALVAGPDDEVTSKERLDGFTRGLAEAGVEVPPALIAHAAFSRDGGLAAVRSLGDRVGAVDHVAAMSDAQAVGAIVGLRELGLSVPHDITVSGFDHIDMLSDLAPSIATVELPLGLFGESAVALALDATTTSQTRLELQTRIVN